MTQEDKKTFLNYIHEVAKDARAKYGNDQNKINHAIANAIAYSSYHDNFLQKSTNDFGEKPRNLSKDDERRRHHIENTYAKRIGEIGDVVELVMYLLGEKSSYVWGQNIYINGGMT